MTRSRFQALVVFVMCMLAGAVMMAMPITASAQIDTGLNAVGTATNLPSGDPRVIAARLINVALGFLAMIMVAYMVYAGFLWMTSGGDLEKVSQAKTMIRNAIIGAIIILSSWGIATYIIRALLQATGGTGGGGDSGIGSGSVGGFGTGGGSTAFQVRSISPTGDVTIRNVEVRFLFTRDVDARTANTSIRVLRASGEDIAGTVVVSGSLATFTPTAACPVPAADRHCFDADADMIARVSGSLRSAAGQVIACGGFAPSCEARFHTGTLVDTASPHATITSPFDGQSLSMGSAVRVLTRATDDAGVSVVQTFVDSRSIGMDAPTVSTTLSFDANVLWDTTGASTGTHRLQSTVHDVDSNLGRSAEIAVALRPAFCFNGRQDGDETGLDCGGSCGACAAGSCSVGTDCATGVCAAGRCVEQPIITDFSPTNGRAKTIITIVGANFGRTVGTVKINGVDAIAPEMCTSIGTATWSPTQVIVQLPTTATTGSIQLRNADSGLSDATNDDRGPRLDDFAVNTTARPGICGAVPDHGIAGTSVRFVGSGFGGTRGRLFFSDREIGPSIGETWADAAVSLNAPVLTPSSYAVHAQVSGVDSNAVSFTLDEPVSTGPPTIDAIDPVSGPIGEYITITGRNFGDRVGVVRVQNAGGESGVADTSFPAVCATAFWRNTSVIVKVPSLIGSLGRTSVVPGTYQLLLRRQDGTPSNSVSLIVESGTPRPGICALLPNTGPVDTLVTVAGDGFTSVPGTVSFMGSGSSRVEATAESGTWTNQRIPVHVPRGAQTGNVRVQVSGKTSNAVLYSVQNCAEQPTLCSGGELCCTGSGACSVGGVCPASSPTAQYAWRTSTGVIPVNPEVIEECSVSTLPSPSPWGNRPGGASVCVNASLLLRFSTHLNPSSVSAANLIVRTCTGTGSDPCITGTTVAARSGYPRVGAADGETDAITFLPVTTWDASSTYQVILTTGIHSDMASGDLPMLERATTCGRGNAYCFRFATRASTDPCRVGSVSVAPDPFTAHDIGERVVYQAYPRSADDQCIALDGSGMDWAWDTGADGRASITNNRNPLPPGNVLDTQNGTAIAETGSGSSVPINATVRVPSSPSVGGTGRLFIQLTPPRVESKGPDCDAACVNAAMWARFNVPMLPESFSAATLSLRRCRNENCRTFDRSCDLGTIALTAAPGAASDAPRTYLTVDPGGCLEPGRFYKMLLRGGPGGVRSLTRLPLTELNDPEGYAWSFHVKTGDDARCRASRLDVMPREKIESVIGARQLFTGLPVGSPDACNVNGQPLIADRSFVWRSEDATVARLWSDGRLDTTSRRTPHCSDRCLNTGSDGSVGLTASCGNGTVETTDAAYCRSGRTPFGDPCVLMARGSSAGEECDLGGDRNGPASSCSAHCLWNGVRATSEGGTCGNGTVDRGEQCDPGRSCAGGPTAGRVCATDAECGAGGLCRTQERNGCTATCLALGSNAGGSVCGNGGALGDGESCDDGNSLSGDGCSADCVHEGSTRAWAVCGNAVVEPGESCERATPTSPWPIAGCDPRTCLHTGTMAIAAGGVCGNGRLDPGEDCDGGEGCSDHCLLLGSSITYRTPSFCGNGPTLETGEQCEAATSGGDHLVDATQLAEITGTHTPGTDGRMSTQIAATYDGTNGSATYGLQCGYVAESSCPAGTGLTMNGCCSARPTITANFPIQRSTNVCRNTLVWARFNAAMDPSSIESNLLVAELGDSVAGCPRGTQPIDRVPLTASGWRSWIPRLWHRVMTMIVGVPAQADPYLWCVGAVTGTVVVTPDGLGSRVSFVMANALKPMTTYRITFRGDPNLTDAIRQGIRTAQGVVAPADGATTEGGAYAWTFTTGPSICTANQIMVRDTVSDHPFLFTTQSEAHTLEATVSSLRDGATVPIVPVAEYQWAWDPWVSSRTDVARMGAATVRTPAISNADATAQNKNGSALVFARLVVTRDTVRTPSTVGQAVSASQLATVMLCERPWPSVALAPFTDSETSRSLVSLAPSFATGPFMHFSTLYCMDAGATGPDDDLPSLSVHAVPPTPLDTSRGILRQYFFTVDDPALAGDGIGIRVVSNPLHLSALSWYEAQGFTGSPQAITVDGYDAIRDGNTVYAAAVNTDRSTTAPLSSTIYVLSRNPDAHPPTVAIFDALVRSWTFNVNFDVDSQNICVRNSDGAYVVHDGATVACTADWECANEGAGIRCASIKSKLQRDTKRIADFQQMTNALERAKGRDGRYPMLNNGTYLQTIVTSRWPSWSSTFGAAIQSTVPQDPINRFLSCGTCRNAHTPCSSDSDCSAAGDSCAARDGYDPATCWNVTTARYQCPRLVASDASTVSRIYQYRAVDGGSRYELSTELEGPAPTRYDPVLVAEINHCSNTGQVCDPAHPEGCTVRATDGHTISTGICRATNGRWLYQGLCTGRDFGVDGVCGNGVRGPGEVCEIGESLPVSCTTADHRTGTKLQTCSDCRAWVDGPATLCVADSMCGNGRIDTRRCYGGAGMKYGQSCTTNTDCEDVRDAPDVRARMACVSVTTVGGREEVCDDGALNGTYGHCNRDCSGFDAYCGDARLSIGELCDNGTSGSSPNGAYCGGGCDLSTSCSLDCRTRAPHCGDAIVQAPQEQCDGGHEEVTSAICRGGTNAEHACLTDADCRPVGGSPGVCGGDPLHEACVDRVGRCSNDATRGCAVDSGCATGGTCILRAARHVRSCTAPGARDLHGVLEQCTWQAWSVCQPIGTCGDGTVDPGEECDDANTNNNDACTNQCKRNVCGDGFVQPGVEECDYGNARNTGACLSTADYGSTCTGCSATCRQVASSGGYCGDGVRNGAEQCDRTSDGTVVGASGITCRSLGFDYAEQTICAHPTYLTDTQGRVLCTGESCCCASGAWGRFSGGAFSTCSASSVDCPRLAGSIGCTEHAATTRPEPIVSGTADQVCTSLRSDVLACSTTCGYTGCHRCQDDAGTGEIRGNVRDAVYSNQPVPNARVSLYLRGIRLTETFTNGDGRFTLSGLNTRVECSQYRIVVDSYTDNPCTGPASPTRPSCAAQAWPARPAENEGTNGGYWPFESDVFTITNFLSNGIHDRNGNIFLAPRVGPGETLVIHTWDGNLGGRYLDAHLWLPMTMKYGIEYGRYLACAQNGRCASADNTRSLDRDCNTAADCGAGNRCNACVHDIEFTRQGMSDMSVVPHSYLYCIAEDGSDRCNTFAVAPETMRYKRGDWGLTGRYSYYLWDYYDTPTPPAWQFYNTIQSTVRIVTQDRLYTVHPPATGPSCGRGRAWSVFTQNAGDGTISIPNGTGEFLCDVPSGT